MIIEKEKSN